jgi:long-chain fatty acid transport protein
MRKSGLGIVVSTTLGIAVVSGFPDDAVAAGFGLREGSTDWLANAFAGTTAKAYDASTSFANPAGMVRLGLNEIDASINVILPSSHFSGMNIGALGNVTPGSQGGNLTEAVATPGLFGVWSYSDDLKFGLAVDSPFGQRIANPTDFVGRFQSLVTSIADINITLSAAYRINEHLSIGGGPVINYLEARLTQAINIGVNPLVGDPVADVHGSNISPGFDIGALYQFNDSTRVGINFRSQIHHTIDANQTTSVPPLLAVVSPLGASRLALGTSPVTTSVTLPDALSVGLYHEINQQWAVFLDVVWTHWSLFKGVTIVPSNGTPATTIPENFRSTWFGAVGVNFRPTEKLTLQAGVAFDESPVTDSNRTTRLPDNNRVLLGFGATYTVMTELKVQAGYLHVFIPQGSINSSASPSAGRIIGMYHGTANNFSIGAIYKF